MEHARKVRETAAPALRERELTSRACGAPPLPAQRSQDTFRTETTMPRRLTGPLADCPPWGGPGSEPSLPEVLADPLIHAVMRRDGVTFGELVCVIARAQVKLRRGLCCLAA